MVKSTKLLYLFLSCLSFYTAHSQNAFDSSFEKAAAVYTKVLNVNSHIYNGSQYIDYDHRITGNPFFASSYFTDGSIVYDGVLYPHVDMFYDILHDDVVIKNYNDTPLILVKEKVSAFNYLNHHFVQLVADSLEKGIENNLFYDVLYNGNAKLFARRKKILGERVSVQTIQSSFTEKDEYFIYNRNVFYSVNDKRSVLNALKDKRSELIKFLRTSKIKFKKNPEAAMQKMIEYYDALNNAK